MNPEECRRQLELLNCIVVMPTYNNAATLMAVVESVRQYCNDILVVNDGSTDDTHRLLQQAEGITVIEYPDGKNRGKGYALKCGLRRAAQMGKQYAITIDSDGQHFADDMPKFVEEILQNPNSLIIGARNLRADNMPGGNTFANKFSNFWFKVETGQTLADTQSGYRLYPLREISKMKFFTPRYEFEVEIIVRCAWRGVRVVNVPIKVIYPPDRVSHFKPLRDFTRISILNTFLVLGALLYYYPKCFLKWLSPRNIVCFFDKYLINSGESVARKSAAVGFGVFMGIVPIWGFQMIVAVFLAHLFKLNKIIVLAAANISIPPAIPFILYASLWTGGLLTNRPTFVDIDSITIETAYMSLFQYVLGSIVFAVVAGVAAAALSAVLISCLRRKRQQQ